MCDVACEVAGQGPGCPPSECSIIIAPDVARASASGDAIRETRKDDVEASRPPGRGRPWTAPGPPLRAAVTSGRTLVVRSAQRGSTAAGLRSGLPRPTPQRDPLRWLPRERRPVCLASALPRGRVGPAHSSPSSVDARTPATFSMPISTLAHMGSYQDSVLDSGRSQTGRADRNPAVGFMISGHSSSGFSTRSRCSRRTRLSRSHSFRKSGRSLRGRVQSPWAS